MSESKRYYDIPGLDLSGLGKPPTEEEIEAGYQAIRNEPKCDWQKFVEEVRCHPETLSSWDGPMSFAEFVRRVEAGEFD